MWYKNLFRKQKHYYLTTRYIEFTSKGATWPANHANPLSVDLYGDK